MSRIDDLLAELAPDGVEFRQLRDVGRWHGGGTPSKQRSEYWRDGTIPWISPKDMGRNVVQTSIDRITEAATAQSSARLISSPSVAVVVRSSILDKRLPVALVPMPASFNQDMRAIVPSSDLDISFLAYMLSSRGNAILRSCRKTGGSAASIDSSKLLSFRIPVPPLEIQREIVRVLDKFTQLEAELEANLTAELERRWAQHVAYRKSLFEFRSEVEWVQLGDIAEYTNGKAHEKFAHPEGTIPMVTARFISRNGEPDRFVKLEDVLTFGNKGDIALVLSDLPNGRALARTFLVDRDRAYAINQRVARIRVNDVNRTLPRFVYHVLNRNSGLLEFDNGVDQTHLSKTQVTRLRFPVPTLAEQVQIVESLDKFDALVNDLTSGLPAELAARRKQYEYYRDKLLTFDEAPA